MCCKIVFRVGLCLFLFTIVSCSPPETAIPEAMAQAKSKEVADSIGTSQVIITLDDKKLTLQQIEWMWPKADDQRIADIAKWWLENELLYAEAQRQGITKQTKAKFLAELMRKKSFSQELRTQMSNAVKISDEQALAYYEENKGTDRRLRQPGTLSFSHIKTKTLEEAQAALERIKAGEKINALAKELSIYKDAKNGGVVKKSSYTMVKGYFGNNFFEAITAARESELIGPIKARKNTYEIARQEGKTEPKAMPFEKVKDKIKSKLERTEKANAVRSLLDSLREKAADKIVKSPRLIRAEKAAEDKPEKSKGRSRSKWKIKSKPE